MPRHLVEIADLSGEDISQLFDIADHRFPQSENLTGLTFLSAFFQESTRTRLGFLAAAASHGATVVDVGDTTRLRCEPSYDQQLVLAESADLLAVRHWDPTFAQQLAGINKCSVINGGAGAKSHPTQALIDAYTLRAVLNGDLAGLNVVFVGDLLRAARSFYELAPHLRINVAQCPVSGVPRSPEDEDQLLTADVIYLQSQSGTDYGSPHLNNTPGGPALPSRVSDLIKQSKALVMHPLPRGRELPDELMHSPRSLVGKQIEYGRIVRGAVLMWLTEPT